MACQKVCKQGRDNVWKWRSTYWQSPIPTYIFFILRLDIVLESWIYYHPCILPYPALASIVPRLLCMWIRVPSYPALASIVPRLLCMWICVPSYPALRTFNCTQALVHVDTCTFIPFNCTQALVHVDTCTIIPSSSFSCTQAHTLCRLNVHDSEGVALLSQ